MTTPSRSGVFQSSVDQRVERFTASVHFDCRLYAHDILACQAHARMLARTGLISPQEADQIVGALEDIRQSIQRYLAGDVTSGFVMRPEWEDIHMHIEQALIERLGDVGRKLHTGRSRNDQVATALRLWIRDALDRVERLLVQLQQAFVSRCDRDRGAVLSGYTHLQRAQPVLAAQLLAGLLRKTGTGSATGSRLPQESQRLPTRRSSPGRN